MKATLGLSRRKGNRGRGEEGKIAVIGAISRKVKAQIIKQADTNTINSFICNTIDRSSIIFTDSFKGYSKVYKYHITNHSKYFAKAKTIHTNTIESFSVYAKIIFIFNNKCFTIQMKSLNKYLKFIY